MSLFRTPQLRDTEHEVLGLIGELREELRDSVAEPQRWIGTLRRMSFARAVQGSNSIEGYNASLDDVVAAVEGEPTLEADVDTRLALSGYRDAMTYVLQIADDEALSIDEGLLKGLHFMMLKHDLSKNPGRWRPGVIHVRDDSTGEIVYEGPPAEEVSGLIDELITVLAKDNSPVLIKASMAHLNLVMIHPFSDGNGRMARCLQTLVLARDQVLAPVFSSIEEFLGRNTEAYYQVLTEVGGGAWHPDRSARKWIRFCLRAHFLQVRTLQRRRTEVEALWEGCLRLSDNAGLPERCAAGLMETAYGLRVRRGSYKGVVESVTGEDISDLTASRDLKAMVDAELLVPTGERRGRYYTAGTRVKRLRTRIRKERPRKADEDPFEIIRGRRRGTPVSS